MIQHDSIIFGNVLEQIGKISNEKIEVEKRERLSTDLNTYPLKRDILFYEVSGIRPSFF